MRISEAALVIDDYIAENIPVFLWGAPGVGKTQLVGQRALIAGAGLVVYHLNILETVDLRGLPHIPQGANIVHWATPDLFQEIAKFPADQLVYVFFDEANTCSPAMMAAMMQIVLDRRAGPHHLPDNVRIIAAGNRQSDRAAANKMPSALRARFAHIDIDPDVDDLLTWGEETGRLSPLIIAYFRFKGDKAQETMFDNMANPDARELRNPRNWERVSTVSNRPTARRLPLVTGIVGATYASDLEAFASVWGKLPTVDQIVADPDGVMVPGANEPGLLFAVCGALTRRATRQNFGAMLRYSERFPTQDFGVMFAKEATEYDAKRKAEGKSHHGLAETRAFIDWADKNQDVVL